MNWRDRTARIVGNGQGGELTKLTKAQISNKSPLLSVLSVPTPAHICEKSQLAPDVEARHIRLIAMLRDNPEIKYAVLADEDADPGAVIVAVAVRGLATCEVRIPKGKFDPFALLDMAGRYSGTLH